MPTRVTSQCKSTDKVVGFLENMTKMGGQLRQAQDSYDKALNQLSQGSGNLLRQTELLKDLGAKTTKSIGMEFDRDADPDRIAPDGAQLLTQEAVQ